MPIYIISRQNEGAPLIMLRSFGNISSFDDRRGVSRIDSLSSCLCEQVLVARS